MTPSQQRETSLSESISRKPKAAAIGATGTADRIVDAAYRCFDRYGVTKATMEDIASTAGVTRATVYKYFPSREHVLARIVALEIDKVNAELRARFVRRASIEESLTECLLLVVRAAARNHYLRGTLQSPEYLSTVADPRSDEHRRQRHWWSRLLDEAAQAGELAADLDRDQIVSWLTLAEQMLLIKIDALDISDRELRGFIQRMVVLPLLARSAAKPARAATSGGSKRGKAR